MTLSSMMATLIDVHHLTNEARSYPTLGHPRIECGTAVVRALKEYAWSINPAMDVGALPLTVFGVQLRERDDMEPEAWRVVLAEGNTQP